MTAPLRRPALGWALATVLGVGTSACRLGFTALEVEGDAADGGTDTGAPGDSTGAPDAAVAPGDAPLPPAGWVAFAKPSPTTDDLWGVVAYGPSDLWVIGSAGVVRQYDGAVWNDHPVGTSNLFMGWAQSATEFIVAGNVCTLQRWSGGAWTDLAPACPGNVDLYGVNGLAPDDWWTFGNGGTIYHWTGAAFVNEKFGSDTHWDMWIRATDDLYVSGSRGTLLHWNGIAFTQQGGVPNETITAITGTATRQFAVSNMGKIITKASAEVAWSTMPSPVATALYDVLALADDDVWAVGAAGAILHYDGVAWSQVASPVTTTLRGVFAVPGAGLRAVGDGGVVLTRP